jgi:GNAT superfamily N-acetyltransferase
MHLRAMTKLDVPAGLRLNELAGWNQTAADWSRFLEASPEGCFVAVEDGRVCGTATTITYENRYAWIGMVLVDPEYRKQGIGTQLLQRTIDYLDHRNIPTMKLDATPLGQPLYSKLGFETEYKIERWTLKRPCNTIASVAGSGKLALTEAQLDPVFRLDQEVFGADRSFLLSSLRERSPGLAIGVWSEGRPQGYAFGRSGLFADHLGPWVAKSRTAAEQVLLEFLTRSSHESLIVDCLTAHPLAIELLLSHGFAHSRSLTRMVRGPNASPGNPQALWAIVGPEFG